MKKAIIIGAGPAGLTAAYELLKKTDVKPIILESSTEIGGISKTIKFKGNRIDIGGHRFFSKSDRVMEWWMNILPVQSENDQVEITYRNQKRNVNSAESAKPTDDRVMLIRDRLSRIFYLRKFFDYPIKMNVETALNLGVVRIFKILVSYFKTKFFPIKEEKSLEDFFINRFGKELYLTFFKDYTEKVWGVKCTDIKPEWGAQRIKGLSITAAVIHAIKSIFKKDKSIGQKDSETSLIERFMYPKHGPGQLWEEVARQIQEMGGEIHFNQKVVSINNQKNSVSSIKTIDNQGIESSHSGDFYFSTMAIKDLLNGFENTVPANVKKVSDELMYRDFITVGLLLNKLKVTNPDGSMIKDNWIYIQESDVKIGRLQVFNNWSPFLVNDPSKIWIGLEYFCNEGDELWNKSEQEMLQFGIEELHKIKIIDKAEVLDGMVAKIPKTYPAYTGSYEHFDVIKDYINNFENLFLVGRNGMHKYNNQDHSMLTAMLAVENIRDGVKTKDNLWEVNTEEDYHEEKK